MARHFKGARAIAFWSFFMFGLERNTQAEDPNERDIGLLRVIKDRFTGQATGKTFHLRYDPITGLLNPIDPDVEALLTEEF
jgi:twinkle protein